MGLLVVSHGTVSVVSFAAGYLLGCVFPLVCLAVTCVGCGFFGATGFHLRKRKTVQFDVEGQGGPNAPREEASFYSLARNPNWKGKGRVPDNDLTAAARLYSAYDDTDEGHSNSRS